jgi:hypothetical protein
MKNSAKNCQPCGCEANEKERRIGVFGMAIDMT